MRIIHTSDIHLDSPMTTRLTHTEATARKREISAGFRRIIDTATAGYDAVIIAGDLFDNERVSIKTLDAVIGAIEAADNVTFFYLPGNHEKERLIESGLRLPKNLNIFENDWTYFKLGDITLAGRSIISADMFKTISLEKDGTNIVVLHGELAAYGDSISKIGISDIEGLPIDYLALGHYHTYTKKAIGARTLAAYCGTPEGRGFDEIGEKGYISIEISESGIKADLIRSASRLMQEIRVDISGAEREIEIEDRVQAALANISTRDLVRVVLTGEHSPESKRDTDALIKRFRERYYYFEAKDESKLKISSDDYKNDKTLKGEFIRLVMSREDLTEDDKADIIECGIRALAGEIE